MRNYTYAVLFLVICFLMWLSLVFSLIAKFEDFDTLFSTTPRAIMVYILCGMVSIVLTFVSYLIIGYLQSGF